MKPLGIFLFWQRLAGFGLVGANLFFAVSEKCKLIAEAHLSTIDAHLYVKTVTLPLHVGLARIIWPDLRVFGVFGNAPPV